MSPRLNAYWTASPVCSPIDCWIRFNRCLNICNGFYVGHSTCHPVSGIGPRRLWCQESICDCEKLLWVEMLSTAAHVHVELSALGLVQNIGTFWDTSVSIAKMIDWPTFANTKIRAAERKKSVSSNIIFWTLQSSLDIAKGPPVLFPHSNSYETKYARI